MNQEQTKVDRKNSENRGSWQRGRRVSHGKQREQREQREQGATRAQRPRNTVSTLLYSIVETVFLGKLFFFMVRPISWVRLMVFVSGVYSRICLLV